MDILQALRAEGCNVEAIPGWERNGRPGHVMTPAGVMWHHTAGSTNGIDPSRRVCITGRTGLSGPLCNIYIDRAGKVVLIARLRANHAGKGSGVVLAEIKRSFPVRASARARGLSANTDGNSYFFGLEIENNGVGELYSAVQIDAVVRTTAALCRLFGWNANRCLHHKQWTDQKIDMSYTGDLWALVAARLKGDAPAPMSRNMNRFPAAVDSIKVPGAPGTWVVGADGGVGAFKGAQYFGSMGGAGKIENSPMAAIAAWDAGGYILVGQDGGTFNFGNVPFIAPYKPLGPEWASGERAVVAAEARPGYELVITTDDGCDYTLHRA